MDKNQSLTQQNQINPGKKATTQRVATILILLSSILPFFNNILKNFFDTESVVFHINGAKQLDLDSAIFFLSMPLSYALIAAGGMFGAHKKSYYAVYVSCYFQLVLVINFMFQNRSTAYFLTQLSLLIIFIVVAILLFVIAKYYKSIESKNEFLNKTLDRYSKIIREGK